MKTSNNAKLLILKNNEGDPVRLIQTSTTSMALVQNKETRRIELVDGDFDYQDTHTLLQKIDLDTKKSSIPLKSIGTLCFEDQHQPVLLDPKPLKDEEVEFPIMMKWSSGAHGAVLGLLIMFAFLIQVKPPIKKENKESLVTIQLEKPSEPVVKKVAPPPAQKPKAVAVAPKKVVHVVPRTNKSKPLLVKRAPPPKVARPQKIAANAPQQFQRLGSLGALSNAIKGSKNGMGSGLRGAGGGTGGIGRGAGMGRGNGTMGRGHDSGGGYEQALYGKGLIAGQVGGGGGGLGSGWGEGTRGSGGFGTKGKGGGHAGYGNSKIGSGSSQFTYPVREDAVVEGGLDREAVDLVIMKNLGQIIYCYELGLQEKSGLRGRVAVDFTINGQGRVSHCSVASSSLRSAKVESCMISKIKTWKFPQPVGGVNVDVNYPFALQRVSQN